MPAPMADSDKTTSKDGSRMTYLRCLVVATALLIVGMTITSSAAAIEFTAFGGAFDDAAGDPVRQAGAHSDVRVRFEVAPQDPSYPYSLPDEAPHQLLAEMPVGLVGDPTAASTCSEVQMKAGPNGNSAICPVGAQIGVARVVNTDFVNVIWAPIYNIDPPKGTPGRFSFNVLGTVVSLNPTIRGGDYGVTVDSGTISQGLAINAADVTFWGVPADPAHDRQRAESGKTLLCFPGFGCLGNVPSQSPRRPFLSLPTSCSAEAQSVTGRLDGWESIGDFETLAFSSDFDDVPFVFEGCERLPFDPSVNVETTSSKADSPTGLGFDLAIPQGEAPNGVATSHVKDVSVTLPEGMSVSPAAANGLRACSDEQLGMGDTEPVQCPAASKIGRVRVDTPLLDEPLSGGVYVGQQQSDDPQSGRMFRMFLVAEGSGVVIKLEGGVKADPITGQLTATFENNPQQPFSSLRVEIFGGSQAALATPATCGTKSVHVHITSWSGKSIDRQSSFDVACSPGLGGFSPSFAAGSVSPVAGAFSPFVVEIAKPDGDSALDGLSVEMPKGVLAKLKGNLGTQVGSVTAFAGSGSNPFPFPGKVFLEGAYEDAPYSLRVVVPTKAGPFDLGEVVVKQKVYVDRATAQVKVVSDAIPTIVKGVPTRLQRLDVNVDKPGFMVNPTSCEPSEVKAVLHSAADQSAPINARFQVGECASLGFSPSLAMALTGKKQKTTGKHPGLRAKLRQASGQAGIGLAKVTLPAALALDPDNAQALCEFTDGTKPDLENHCPKGSIVGRAKASTPLLERGLTGDVYFVKNVRRDAKTGNEIRTLPMIVVALRGEIAINLKGEASTTKSGRLVSTFSNVPDAPISAFNLNIAGGSNGILAVTRTRKSKINLCAKPSSHRAAVEPRRPQRPRRRLQHHGQDPMQDQGREEGQEDREQALLARPDARPGSKRHGRRAAVRNHGEPSPRAAACGPAAGRASRAVAQRGRNVAAGPDRRGDDPARRRQAVPRGRGGRAGQRRRRLAQDLLPAVLEQGGGVRRGLRPGARRAARHDARRRRGVAGPP